MNKLEEAAREYENKEIFVLDGEYTKESVVNAFITGAEWQKSNLWFDIKKDGYPEYEKSNNLALKKYIVRAECENMCIKESVTISFLVNQCQFNIEMNHILLFCQLAPSIKDCSMSETISFISDG